MKNTLLILSMGVLLLLSANFSDGQPVSGTSSGIPLKETQYPLFGPDIIIHDQPDRNQRTLSVCSAFNGWLYAVYSYRIVNQSYIVILKSTDDGLSWNVLLDSWIGSLVTVIDKMQVVALGTTESNIKVFVGILFRNTESHSTWAIISRFDGNTGEYEDEILQDQFEQIRDFSMATDILYPASGAIPNSLAVFYSRTNYPTDSLCFAVSSNGGNYMDTRFTLPRTPQFATKVGLAYGRSATYPEGRYFAVWEEKADENAATGHLYTAHTGTNFHSIFSTPVNLDSLDPSTINLARNPVIACQYNNADNYSSDLTEVVLFDKFIQGQNRFDVAGAYNLQAVSGSTFQKLSIYPSSDYNIQPSVCFNPFDSTFLTTFYDSSIQKLLLFKNDQSITNTGSWQVVSSGYNDSGDLSDPFPNVKLDYGKRECLLNWEAERSDSNGVGMFDAQFHYNVGIPVGTFRNDASAYGVFPNPGTSTVFIYFDLKVNQRVQIILYDLMGKYIGTIKDDFSSSGRNYVNYDLSKLPSATYVCRLITADFTGFIKIIKR